MHKNKCIACNKYFFTPYLRTKTCESCRNIKSICKYCGKEFFKKYIRKSQEYCSPECSSKSINKKRKFLDDKRVKCEVCDKIFMSKGNSSTKLCLICREKRDFKNKYKLRIPRKKMCGKCGKEFFGHNGQKYCNTCNLKYECEICKEKFKTRIKTKNHVLNIHKQKPSKQNYSKITRNKSKGKQNKNKILKAKNLVTYDDGICAYCRKNKPESFHHIMPRKYGGPTVFENCICLCNKCHDEVEILTDNLFKQNKYFSIKELKSFIVNRGFPNEN